MSIMAIAWALKVKTGSPTTKLVLIKLADNANDEGKCWPSQRHIAEHTELSERSVREHIKVLVDAGLVVIEERFIEGVRIPNVYYLQLRQSVGVGHQVPGGGAPDAPRVGQEVPGNKPSEVNRQLNLIGPANAAPSSKRSKPNQEPEGFAEFYVGYPRKVGRPAAAKAFRSALLRTDRATIMAGLARYAIACGGKDLEFIAHPSTWLNQDRWNDQVGGSATGTAIFEPTGISGWCGRLEVFHYGAGDDPDVSPKGSWSPKWGPRPGEPGCCVPPEAQTIFDQRHAPRKTG